MTAEVVYSILVVVCFAGEKVVCFDGVEVSCSFVVGFVGSIVLGVRFVVVRFVCAFVV